jgi:hypothetical protein
LRKILILLSALIAAAAIVGFFYLKGKEYIIRIPESDIQEKVAEKLPMTKRYLLFFEVTLQNPRIALENGSNRINGGIDVDLNITVDNLSQPLGGSIDISGGIKYDPARGELFLTNPTVEKLNIQGIPETYIKQTNSVISKALAEYYEKNPIYTLNALDAKQAATMLVLKSVVIDSKVLVVTLGI